MNLEELLAAAKAAAKEAGAAIKAAGGNVTEEQIKAADEATAEVKRLQKMLAETARVSAALSALTDDEVAADREDTADTKGAAALSIGQRYVKSARFKRFLEDNPGGPAEGSAVTIGAVKIGGLEDLMLARKGQVIGSGDAHAPAQRFPMVDLTSPVRLTLLDLISTGNMDSSSLEYVQVVSDTNNAANVPEATSLSDGEKPLSEFGLNLADLKATTFADGLVVTNQMLADAPLLASFLESRLARHLEADVEKKILLGTGASGQPKGLLTTSGVQEHTYTSGDGIEGLIKAVRQAKTKAEDAGALDLTVLINPQDEEEMDFLQDKEGRYRGNGPWGLAPTTLWTMRRIPCRHITKGQAVIGDLRGIQLLDREGLSIQAFNQHADFARRNLTYVRAELRAGVAIWEPKKFVVVKAA